jgi:hypothetical protein
MGWGRDGRAAEGTALIGSESTTASSARWDIDQALAQIPRVLTLQDRDPSSPTYGCFDRNYWHYRTQDFPSGMYQELALPLAQVYALPLPANRWRKQPRLRELALAGVRYAARSAHADGSCDDYYPFERALGATAFAASACAHALGLLHGYDADLPAFLKYRSRWLLDRQESGRLANHQAFGCLGGSPDGSRNTCQVLPSGFERLASDIPEAAYVADGWLQGASAGRRGYPDDDRIFSHWLHDMVEAYRLRVARAGVATHPWRPPSGRTSFEAAGLHVIREGDLSMVIASGKGGVFRAYYGEHLLRNDTGLVAVTEDGSRFVSHGVDPDAEVTWEDHAVVVRGRFQYAPRQLATPMKQVAFRLVNCTAGRLAPDLVRRILQRSLITGKRPAPFRFERRISWGRPDGLKVRDRITADGSRAPRVVQLYGSTDATSIYVATSNLWQEASLGVWGDLAAAAETLYATSASS